MSTQTNHSAEPLTITACVTPYESQDGEECDWSGYVAEQLADRFPGAHVSVEYGSRNSIHASGPGADAAEDEDTYADLLAGWWDELCRDSENPAWGESEEGDAGNK